jgi:hypothetical protein
MLVSHLRDLGSVPGDFIWDSWWREWHRSRFSCEFLGFPLLLIIQSLLYTDLSLPHEVCDSLDQVAHYHTLGPKLQASSLTWHMAVLRVSVVLLQVYTCYFKPFYMNF